MSDKANIIISGAGIAGMSSALALAKNGHKVTLYEKAHALTEIGAGIQLAPNATRLLRNWEILEDIKKIGIEPDHILMKDGRNDCLLNALPIKKVSLSHWQAPYITIHRAHLQKILYDSIIKNPLIDLHLASEIVDYQGNLNQGYSITIKNNKTTIAHSDLLIISDGVWSPLRQKHLHEKSIFSGYISWRATLAFEDMPKQFLKDHASPSIHVYMYKSGHFIIYPAQAGKIYNFIAVTHGKVTEENWSKKANKTDLLSHFSTWHKNITDIMQKANDWTYWPLFQMPNLRFNGPQDEIFIGDASHAATPFAAQGATMAIEDAAALSTIIAQQKNLKKAIKIFAHTRQVRLEKVIKRGNLNRFVYHARGPVAFARNMFMKTRAGEKFLMDLNWLYNFDATNIDEK